MNENDIARALVRDPSARSTAFRESLLARCLAELDANDGAELSDDDLGLLSAAGTPGPADQPEQHLDRI